MNQDASQEQTPPTNPDPETNPTPPTAQQPSPIAQQFSEQATAQDGSANGGKLPSAFELFDASKKAVMLNLGTFVLISLLPALLQAASSVANSRHDWVRTVAPTPHDLPSAWVTLWVVVGLYSLLTIAARPVLEVLSVKGQNVSFGEAFRKGLSYFWRMLGLSVLIGLIIVVGLILLIVPGLIFIRRYFLATYFLVDQNLGIRESMRRSAAATKTNSGAVWGVIGVIVLISITSAIPYIGPFVAAVLGLLYSCAPALRYQQLKG